MKLQELVTLLPCHSFDDFPFYLEGEAADGLLAAYTALWHPALIHAVQKMPVWRRSDDDGQAWEGCLVALPQVCQEDLPGYWLDETRRLGAVVLEGDQTSGRDELVDAALAELDGETRPCDECLVADFRALGLCHLLTEVLTVQMRYTSLLDEDRFRTLLVEAAGAAISGAEPTAREKLQACFDCLAEAKDHFYPVETYLIDLTLVAASTLGRDLAAELDRKVPLNLLINGQDAATLAEQHPETLTALRQALDEGRVTLVGGETDDTFRPPLATVDTIIDELNSGLEVYRRALGHQPEVYGRRRFGLTPVLPQLLVKRGFRGAVHFTLDDGRFPRSSDSTLGWEGNDGSVIAAFARLPLDAARSDHILTYPQQMSDAMDMDHVAALCYAHWPNVASPWYRDIQRISNYTQVLGKPVTLQKFFEETESTVRQERFDADEYHSPYLRQAVDAKRPDPVAGTARVNRSVELQRCASTVDALAILIGGQPADAEDQAEHPTEHQALDRDSEHSRAGQQASLDAAVHRFAAALPRREATPVNGYLVVNPYSFARQVVLETPRLQHPPSIAGPVEAAYQLDGRRQVVAAVPPLGYAWMSGDSTASWQTPSSKPLAEDDVLRNEHFEVCIDRHTGGIKSVHTAGERGNQLSQRLALRLPVADGGPGPYRRAKPEYSVMKADTLEITDRGPLTAAITSCGQLLDKEGQLLARYRQTVSLVRTIPVLNFDIQLEPLTVLEGDPWQAYYASRFAWPYPDAEIYRSMALGTQATNARRLESPHFVQWQVGKWRTTLLTGGLPYHLRVDGEQLDTLLLVEGEAERCFQLAIGFQLPQPQAAALDFLAPDLVLEQQARPPQFEHAWLFRVDAQGVLVTHCEPAIDGRRVSGIRLRLLETAGRSVKTNLFAFRRVGRARKLDFAGQGLGELPVEGDRIMIEMGPHECSEVELIWHDDRHD